MNYLRPDSQVMTKKISFTVLSTRTSRELPAIQIPDGQALQITKNQ